MSHSEVTWIVLGIVEIGTVTAADRPTAEVLAAKRYGATHDVAGVQSEASRAIEEQARAARQRAART